MLTAIMDCLVQTELAGLVTTLRRDGILCLPADTCIDILHDELGKHVTQPIVIYGAASLSVPYDDCPRLWLACGPSVDHDISHAPQLGTVTDGDLQRRTDALRADYQSVTYVEALCFMADAVAKQCVHSMGLGEKAADIVLRHVSRR